MCGGLSPPRPDDSIKELAMSAVDPISSLIRQSPRQSAGHCRVAFRSRSSADGLMEYHHDVSACSGQMAHSWRPTQHSRFICTDWRLNLISVLGCRGGVSILHL